MLIHACSMYKWPHPLAVIVSALDMLLVQLGPKIVSALQYIKGPDFRGSFYTDLTGKALGTNEAVCIIVGVRISEVYIHQFIEIKPILINDLP